MRYVVVDLEATCWARGTQIGRQEIIEIGAVLLSTARGPATAEFQAFVQPVKEPKLSEFCIGLTTIRQADVERAEPFPAVLPRLLAWIGAEPFRLCSWGAYDLKQLRVDCSRHGLPLPPTFEPHINVKTEFAAAHGIKPLGVQQALAFASLTFEGTPHRGLDDARNIARLAMQVLPALAAG